MSRIIVGPARRSISESSGLFQPSMNIASAVTNIGATTRPTTSSTNAGFLPSYQWPTNWISQPTTKKPAPQPSQTDTLPPETCWASQSSAATTALTATPRTALPRVRYQAATTAKKSQAGVRATAAGGQRRPREEHADAENDHRHADEVADDVAPIAVVFGVLGEELGGGAHGGPRSGDAPMVGQLAVAAPWPARDALRRVSDRTAARAAA